MNITNVHDLRDAYKEKHPKGHFFDSDTLRFFGESFSNMRLLKKTVEIIGSDGQKHTCYVLSSLQNKPFGGRKRAYFYFDVNTLEDIDCQI